MAEIKTPLILQRQDSSHPLSPWKILDLTMFSLVFILIFCLVSVKALWYTCLITQTMQGNSMWYFQRAYTCNYFQRDASVFQSLSLSAFLRRKWYFSRQYYESYLAGRKLLIEVQLLAQIFSRAWQNNIKTKFKSL